MMELNATNHQIDQMLSENYILPCKQQIHVHNCLQVLYRIAVLKLVFFNVQQIFFQNRMTAFEELIQKFHETMPLEQLSSKAWLVRQDHSTCHHLPLKAIVNYETFLFQTKGLFKHALDSIYVFFYQILLLGSYTGFYYWILFHALKSLFPLSVPEIDSQSKC